ncbi:MAG: heparinase II/III-family protein, partial [Gammaproteobacteria bacterium]|nr:heparinase II/III-family protein [Gammaproteobacteria bacterium]
LNRELENRQARRWQEEGRRRLEERVLHLVEEDGSFSQHSVVYHRVLIDTLSMAEVWRRKLGLKKFSDTFYKKAKAATLWLKEFTNVASGDAPNIGPNDGTRLLPLSDTDYRDFRPSVQLASVLFFNARSYAKQGSWNLPCKWLNIPIPDAELEMGKSKIMDSGGYAVIRNQRSSVYLRFPRFRFRPTHADALHVDFWIDNKNILRDGGSFSYNTEDVWLDYFPGTVSHNTVQFDERDQMPRISRFLFGNWLATKFHSKIENENGIQSFSVGYQDSYKAKHNRRIELTENDFKIYDNVSGFKTKAVLRWRLNPSDWVFKNGVLTDGKINIDIQSDAEILRNELTIGWESRYYWKKKEIPVLEVELQLAGNIITTISWI